MLTQDEWFKAICESYSNPPVVVDGKQLPGFPSDEIQANTTGQTGAASLQEAFGFYQDCVENFGKLGMPMRPEHHLLDFGVGWGRIARFFLRELPLENIHGVDVVDEFAQICRQTFGTDNFHVSAAYPPTTLPDGKFNFIVGYSVFSHLSEDACAQWMREFHRILAPGGRVALTTRGRSFFDFCESLKDKGNTGYLDSLSKMFDDFNAARARYDRGELVHSNYHGVTGGGVMTADFYGETFIPEQYAKTAYADLFVLEKFLPEPAQRRHLNIWQKILGRRVDVARHQHPTLFFRKK